LAVSSTYPTVHTNQTTILRLTRLFSIRYPHADQVVDERAVITVSITYPLTRSTMMTVTSKVGHFTRQDLVNAFVKAYEDIYDAEAAVTTDRDDKPYGIWGHDLDDLILEGLHRDEQGIWHPEVAS
jgi:hypothetical protein